MSMHSFFHLPTYFLFVIIFGMILIFNWGGYRYRKNQIRKYPEREQEKMGSIEGSILGTMGLLLGFTFSVALSKFEARRHIIVEEANLIGTAILRCDLYPDSVRSLLRADFKEYVETRIAYYQARNDEDMIMKELEKAELISRRIWKRTVLHSNDGEGRLRSMQMIPVLNNIIDIKTTRDASRLSRVPPLILWTLLTLVVIAAFLLGNDYKGRNRNISLLIGYAMVMTLTLNLITELNHSREGFINLNEAAIRIINLRKLV